MTTYRTSTILFWVLMLNCLHGLLVVGWRTYDYYVRLQLPLYSLWFFSKGVFLTGVALIGYWLYVLTRQYRQTGFFTTDAIRTVRWVGTTLLALSVVNSVFVVMQDVAHETTPDPHREALWFRFLMNYLFEAPTYLFLSLLVFLFANFMQRAIAVKSDNESII